MDSVLSYYKKLIALRKAPEYKETFTYGSFQPIYEETENIFGFLRVSKESGQRILTAANFGKEACTLSLPGTAKKVLLSNMKKESEAEAEIRTLDRLPLESCEAVVLLLEGGEE